MKVAERQMMAAGRPTLKMGDENLKNGCTKTAQKPHFQPKTAVLHRQKG